jgi:hypothetical protein
MPLFTENALKCSHFTSLIFTYLHFPSLSFTSFHLTKLVHHTLTSNIDYTRSPALSYVHCSNHIYFYDLCNFLFTE